MSFQIIDKFEVIRGCGGPYSCKYAARRGKGNLRSGLKGQYQVVTLMHKQSHPELTFPQQSQGAAMPPEVLRNSGPLHQLGKSVGMIVQIN